MKRIKIYSYALFFLSLMGTPGALFSHSVVFKAVVCLLLLAGWGLFLVLLERRFFRPGRKARYEASEEGVKNLVAKEIWEGKEADIDGLCQKILVYVQEEISALNMEMFQKKAEYSALQSQINPHFLYNTLETIRSQAITDGDNEIAEMVRRLSSIFRYSISREGEMVTLRDEINNIRNYMKIMEFRFYDRFELEIDVDEEERIYDLYVPRLILQPLVENAISHGLDETVEGGIVRIEAVLADDLIVTVSDNGKGMSLSELDDLNEKIHAAGAGPRSGEKKGSGIALFNINQRISLLYGKKYGLNLYSSENCGTDVELILPVIDKRESKTGGKDSVAGESA